MDTILVVDDQKNMRDSLSITLSREGYLVHQAAGGREALERIKREFYDLIISDLKMEGLDGLGLLREVKTRGLDVEVIIMTAYGTIESAVEAMKQGAYDYITKPFSPEELILVVKKVLEKRGLARQVRHLRRQLQESYGHEEIIGQSQAMSEILRLVAKVAPTMSNVFITGESGVGKDLVARAIHKGSQRSAGPFVILNCSAIPEGLLESELFGHCKGAFTGAVSDRRGLFEEADGGTLFLDEIGETTPSLQAKLLRFLEEGELRHVGDNRVLRVDVRLVAATNKDVDKAIRNGELRQDLFYRLNVVPIHLLPLRERKEDIPVLAGHLLEKLSRKLGKRVESISDRALSVLSKYHWPGNVRELENIIERAAILTSDEMIDQDDLPPYLGEEEHIERRMTLPAVEKRYILKVLKQCSGNQKETAAVLGLSKTTLWRKLKEFEVSK